MGSINVTVALDITVNGESYGLICYQTYNISCCDPSGTYRVFYWEGMLFLVKPGANPPWPEPSDTGDNPKVFCDPCKNKCTIDNNPLKYGGDQKWLFTTYVNNSPDSVPILIDQFNVNKNFPSDACNDISGYKGKLTVDDKTICCALAYGAPQDPDVIDIYKEPVQKELKDLMIAFKQPKIDFNGDPSEACLCGCPGFCGPSADDCAGIGQILSVWRSFESENCVLDG